MDEAAIGAEKNKRIKGRAFWLLFLFQMPVLLMWMTSYKGYLSPAWLAANWLLIAYFRAKTTTYIARMGVYGFIDPVNHVIMAYQERPWYFLLPIPMLVGPTAMVHFGTDPGATRWMQMASCWCVVLIVLTCILEPIRKWRL